MKFDVEIPFASHLGFDLVRAEAGESTIEFSQYRCDIHGRGTSVDIIPDGHVHWQRYSSAHASCATIE